MWSDGVESTARWTLLIGIIDMVYSAPYIHRAQPGAFPFVPLTP